MPFDINFVGTSAVEADVVNIFWLEAAGDLVAIIPFAHPDYARVTSFKTDLAEKGVSVRMTRVLLAGLNEDQRYLSL